MCFVHTILSNDGGEGVNTWDEFFCFPKPGSPFLLCMLNLEMGIFSSIACPLFLFFLGGAGGEWDPFSAYNICVYCVVCVNVEVDSERPETSLP